MVQAVGSKNFLRQNKSKIYLLARTFARTFIPSMGGANEVWRILYEKLYELIHQPNIWAKFVLIPDTALLIRKQFFRNRFSGRVIWSRNIVVDSPRRWKLLHYMAMVFSVVGVTCLLVSRGHYTIDVIVAYWITTRVFWQYHTMANVWLLRTDLQGRNHLTKVFWYPLFRFMEANVYRPLPRKWVTFEKCFRKCMKLGSLLIFLWQFWK